jgi:branched-chain amino acid aminotransferase
MPAMLAILDGTIMPATEATVPATDEGLLRGDGVFEVIRLYGGRPFALDDHLARLERSSRGLRLPVDLAAVRADVEALLAANDPGDAVLRVVLTRGGRRLAIVEPQKALPATLALKTVTYAPTRILDGIKSLSYGANMLARRLAEEAGADEALLVTPHGRVLEGPTSAFFCSLDGETLVTPPLADHVLDSITRRRLLALGVGAERAIARDELAGAREAFLASTLREVHPVHAIDGVTLAAAPGPLTRAAAERMREHVAAELAALA